MFWRSLWPAGLFTVLLRSEPSSPSVGRCSSSAGPTAQPAAETLPVQTQARPTCPPGASVTVFRSLPLSRRIPGRFLEASMTALSSFETMQVPGAGYGHSFSFCPCQPSFTERQRPLRWHSRPYTFLRQQSGLLGLPVTFSVLFRGPPKEAQERPQYHVL